MTESRSHLPVRRILIVIFTAFLAANLAYLNTLKTSLTRLLPKTTPPSPSRAMSTGKPSLSVTPRPWNARGHADHGWLYTFHTFSFASYHDPSHAGFGPLRVVNEDRVRRGTGFGTHSHAEYLIWSYVVSGALEHRDSMGNVEELRRGEVQFTSAGTGIRHSEFNRRDDADVHFLQIWAKPSVRGLEPHYATRRYPDEMKENALVRVMESVERHGGGEAESDPIPLHADVSMDASILSPGKSVVHKLVADGPRNLYVQVVMGGREQPLKGGARVKVGDVEIGEGDGAYIRGAVGPGEVVVESTGARAAEFLLFDMGLE